MDLSTLDSNSRSISARTPSNTNSVIVGHELTKQFGRTKALDGLNINVPTGSVYALLGRNGAGKSTLIQLLMGMLEPTSGSIEVLGYNPITDGVAMKQRLGYIPERMPMYDWMTVDQILSFVSGMYSRWSAAEEERLSKQFRLQRTQKVGALSRGNRALLSLVIAMSHRPDLVLLDECTSGMDAMARRDFERSVIDALSETGRSVLFAGHQIDEMERICDWVGIMHSGRMIVEMPLEELKSKVVTVRASVTDDPLAALPDCEILTKQKSGSEQFVTVRTSGGVDVDSFRSGVIKEVVPLSLEEIFVALMTAEDNR